MKKEKKIDDFSKFGILNSCRKKGKKKYFITIAPF